MFSGSERNAVGTRSKYVLGRRSVVRVVVKRVMEDEFGLGLGNIIRNIKSDTLGPIVPKALHLTHLLGMFGRYIIGLREVVCKVEELPATIC